MLRFSHPLPLPPRSASASQDYFDIVKNPMDLGSVKKRLENSCYKMIHEFAADTQLCFDNAILYNGQESDVSKVAKEMKVLFEKELTKLTASIDLEYGPSAENSVLAVKVNACEKDDAVVALGLASVDNSLYPSSTKAGSAVSHHKRP